MLALNLSRINAPSLSRNAREPGPPPPVPPMSRQIFIAIPINDIGYPIIAIIPLAVVPLDVVPMALPIIGKIEPA